METPHRPVLETGRNCWCKAEADRVGVAVDAAAYFKAFTEACQGAQRQILILGWDFDRRERLHRDDRDHPEQDQLGNFLVSLVKSKPHLHLYLLSWDFNMIYATERELLPALRLRMQTPPRFHFRLDGHHPPGASHHQKVVVIDDSIAFTGGIDLSRWRWDTCEHAPDDPRRRDPNGKPYQPFHDMMWVFQGAVAQRLGDLARERWCRAHGRRIKPPAAPATAPWPSSVPVALTSTEVALARTEPAYRGNPTVGEIRQLYEDSIAAAQRHIYIENQYFTATRIAKALAKRLAEPDGPEIVMVFPQRTGGWLEQMTMDVLRGRVVERLRRADRHDRLRIYYPYQVDLGEQCISLHAKLMIVDDRLLRIGSANASARSMGLDTECDAVIEASPGDDETAAFITAFQHRLLAEHLDCKATEVARIAQDGLGLIATIEALRSDKGRSLHPLDCSIPAEVDDLVPDSGVIDPPEPFSPDYFVAQYVPREGRAVGRRRVMLFVVAILLLLGLAAAWRWSPLQAWLSPTLVSNWLDGFDSPVTQAAVAIGAFTLAALLMVPITLLALISGMAFSGWQAFGYALTGAFSAALIGFLAGRYLSAGLVKRMNGSRLAKLSKRLAKRGTVAVAVLRLVPIAPFAVFNIVAGSSHLGWRQFTIGSLLGLAPGMAAITLFSGTLWQAVRSPSWTNVGIALAAGVGLIMIAWLVKRWLRSG